MIWLLIATILRAADSYLGPFLVDDRLRIFKLLSNIAGASVLAGSTIAIIRRLKGLTPNLPRDPGYYLVHVLFIIIIITGFMLDGMAAAGYRYEYESPSYDPIGFIFYTWASSLDTGTLITYYRALWMFHMVLAHMTLALIPLTNLWHIPVAGINIALSRKGKPAQVLRSYPDIDKRIEEDKPIGVVKLSDTTWKQRLDYEACTSCMRCTNACPAFASGKILSPREVIVTMRDMMYKGLWDKEVWSNGSEISINPEAIWSCVTCGACVNECPVLIHHVDTIIDIRRGMISSGSEDVPEDALNTLYNMQQTGNPYGYNPMDREEWIRELAEKFGEDIIAKPGEEYDYLYWIGCVASYDQRIRSVPENVIKILKKAGIKIAVMPDEGCSGEPALRMGEETLFVEMMKMNLENMSQYKFKKLLVHCPHCYNIFKNEYKRYRNYLASNDETKHLAELLDRLEVVHHSILLSNLLKEGKIKTVKEVNAAVTYHDPCYLGRWNGVYDEPRKVLTSVRGLRIREMPRNRDRSFCCGGGGGHMFFEIKRGTRISRIRAEEAASTLKKISNGDKIVAVACPFCNTMFRGESEDFGFKVKDIAEILGEALEE
ncbi:MAG: 4Fe-4S dicluster domain-containing protein [Desulfurococcales archaeon]|nr:4Fe-4S dicluster domain-containing protein [Desulfurococcales archaeon]